AARRGERREEVLLPVRRAARVELGAELLHEEQEALLVLGAGVGRLAARYRPLPVDVGAVEDPGRGARAALAADDGEVAAHVEVEAGVDERGAALGGRRRLREVVGPGPAAERDEDLRLGADGLELLQLVEVPGEHLAG